MPSSLASAIATTQRNRAAKEFGCVCNRKRNLPYFCPVHGAFTPLFVKVKVKPFKWNLPPVNKLPKPRKPSGRNTKYARAMRRLARKS